MENQSKYIMIERNKFAALVKAHRKCLQMLSILTYAHTVKEVQLTFTLEVEEHAGDGQDIPQDRRDGNNHSGKKKDRECNGFINRLIGFQYETVGTCLAFQRVWRGGSRRRMNGMAQRLPLRDRRVL